MCVRCGISSSSELECEGCGLPLGLVDERYEIHAEIGRGGMGVVYGARDVNLDRRVALKLIAPELVKNQDAIDGFTREARLLAQLRSPNVVLIYAFGRYRASFFFAMELVSGVTLAAIIDEFAANGAQVPLPRAITILKQLAHGLDAVHAAGAVHRDIKPDNVLIETGSGRPVLIDFGLAIPKQGADGAIVGGTPDYAAPEQVRGAATLSSRADNYAFAVMSFELLSGGRLPFEAETPGELFQKHATESPRKISSVRPDLAILDPVFIRALAKVDTERFPTCGEFVRTIEAKVGTDEEVWSISPRASQPQIDTTFHVLVVDDDPVFARFVSRAAAIAFHGVDAKVHVATSGDEAIQLAKRHWPSLVLLDYGMPDMDGVETLGKLRALPRGGEIRAAVVSSSGDAQRWRFSVLGVDDFIAKPVTLPDLLRTLETIATHAGWKRAVVPKRSSRPSPVR